MTQSEKTEKATPYKLEKAREKGQVSKSTDIVGIASLATIILLISVFWQSHLSEICRSVKQYLILMGHLSWSVDNLSYLFNAALMQVLRLFTPFALAIVITVILSTLIQTGFVFSTKPLTPDFKRLNPITGFKKIWSVKLAFDSGKNIIKLLLTGLWISYFLKNHLLDFLQLMHTNPKHYPAPMIHLFLAMAGQLWLILSVVALVDLLFSRWKYGKDNRMSKQEIKDEYKHREGDPKIKSKLKQLQKELRSRTASIKQVKQADVVVTNPTHIAIALKYNRISMPAPKVICKAAGELAGLVRREANKHRIPIIEDKSFARALFQSVQLNQYIDEQFFPVAAAIFNHIYALHREKIND